MIKRFLATMIGLILYATSEQFRQIVKRKLDGLDDEVDTKEEVVAVLNGKVVIR